VEVVRDDRDAPEEVAPEEEAEHPEDAARDVEDGEARVRHPADACHEGRERADDRDEACQDDGLAAVPLVERLRAQEVLPVEPARRLAREDLRTHPKADGVVDRVAEHRGRAEDESHDRERQWRVRARSKGPDREEEGVTGEERRHDEPGLAEHYREEERVEPEAEVSRPLVEVAVEVEEDVDQVHGLNTSLTGLASLI
jgi:hypothetical protein